MSQIKAIETVYKGYRFRSRLEARWAVFFDAIGVKWEYEPQGFDLGEGLYYLPDFLLHGVTINHGNYEEDCDIYVEVKGNITEKDKEKIERFANVVVCEDENGMPVSITVQNKIIVVGKIPDGDTVEEIIDYITGEYLQDDLLFNFYTIDGDWYGCYPGVSVNGVFTLYGGDHSYLYRKENNIAIDESATVMAYAKARQARFEHGEKPVI